MSEEEIIKKANIYKRMVESESSRNGFDEILIGLLDLYNKEKEKNEKLQVKNRMLKYENNAYGNEIIRLDNELQNEKEHSKYEWIRQNCLPQYLIDRNYISKDKIKEKINKIDETIQYAHRENNKYSYSDYTGGDDSWSRKKVDLEIKQELQDLLEEDNK